MSQDGRRLLHPGKLTFGTQSHGSLVQMIFIFNWVIFRFHINFQGYMVTWVRKTSAFCQPSKDVAMFQS